MVQHKTCPRCRRTFSLREYGSQGYCRACWREYQAERRRRGPRRTALQKRLDLLRRRVARLERLLEKLP